MTSQQRHVSFPLRLHYPAVFDRLVELLTCAGLNAYDVIAESVGPTEGGDVVVRIHYGRRYDQRIEQTFDEASLLTLDAKVIAFFQEVARECHKQNIAEYRTFMGRTKP
ncbi:hypothetical protein LLE49_12300 [Alicyclobacillus tolerans]|uniref:hypothetical protein n=1 Tax=Alicyclobacillus tolerans TaxID=90970 RepID=UPI001F2179AF|nr:hypothetical protein [Alicyclobacillus tolerans]MCF8565498.1 hypothetical protein [Alicyclobacillus tolerans]